MKFTEPDNVNYAAVVVSIKSLTPLATCDNVVGTPLFGFQAIVSKATEVGELGIVFPAETRLSEEYARENYLYRHSNLNKDDGLAGYLEDSARVRAMKFRGHRSDCLFMPLSSLKYTGINPDELSEGDTFDTINGKEICRKYVLKTKAPSRMEKNKVQKFNRVDTKYFPLHYDTENYWRNSHVVPVDRRVIVTQKIHGTSIRISNTIVARELKSYERLLKKLGVKISESGYDYVFGSRKVTKDINNPNQDHYYKSDIWSTEGKKLEGMLPEGYIVYGELIGWTADGAPIQKGYTYRLPEKTCALYVYRVAIVNSQGRVTDLAWDQLKEFCNEVGLKYVPELWVGLHQDLKVEDYIDKRFFASGFTQAIPLEDDPKLVDEGICIRVDGLATYTLKAKSPIFLANESKMLDEEARDLESEGSEEV